MYQGSQEEVLASHGTQEARVGIRQTTDVEETENDTGRGHAPFPSVCVCVCVCVSVCERV